MIEAQYWTVVEGPLAPQLMPVYLRQADEEEFDKAVHLIDLETNEPWLVKEGDFNSKDEMVFCLEKLSGPGRGNPKSVSISEINANFVRAVIFSKLLKK